MIIGSSQQLNKIDSISFEVDNMVQESGKEECDIQWNELRGA